MNDTPASNVRGMGETYEWVLRGTTTESHGGTPMEVWSLMHDGYSYAEHVIPTALADAIRQPNAAPAPAGSQAGADATKVAREFVDNLVDGLRLHLELPNNVPFFQAKYRSDLATLLTTFATTHGAVVERMENTMNVQSIDAVLTRLRERIAKYGTQKAVAEAAGVSSSYLNDVLHGARAPRSKLLDWLGFLEFGGYVDADEHRAALREGSDA